MDLSAGVILPSAGSGRRMVSDVPKQFLPLGQHSVMYHTIARLLSIRHVRHLVIPVAPDQMERVSEIAATALVESGRENDVTLNVIHGGAERMDSVWNGLKVLSDKQIQLVMVHDVVRPCIPLDAVHTALMVALDKGAAILGVPSRDTVKLVDDENCVKQTPDRKLVWLAQTPQVFQRKLFFEAYMEVRKSSYVATDDASVVEYAGHRVYMITGSNENIKITYKSDFALCENWLSNNPVERRE